MTNATLSRYSLILLGMVFLAASCGGSQGRPVNGPTQSVTTADAAATDSSDSPNSNDAVAKILWQEREAETPEEIKAEVLAPRHYGFMLPVRSNPLATYFWGPRVFSSYEKSAGLESGTLKTPVILLHSYQHPLQYLMAKRLKKYSFEIHPGIDLVAPEGTPIYATGDGVVLIAGTQTCVGETVVIRHTVADTQNVVFSIYNHLQKGSFAKIKAGDSIAKGTEFAKSGHTGSEDCIEGSHLHFEFRALRKGDLTPEALTNWGQFISQTVSVNPADYIKEVDDACQKRKNLEAANAVKVQAAEPWALAPLSAGRCGLKYESRHGGAPAIYGLEDKKDLRQLGYPE